MVGEPNGFPARIRYSEWRKHVDAVEEARKALFEPHCKHYSHHVVIPLPNFQSVTVEITRD